MTSSITTFATTAIALFALGHAIAQSVKAEEVSAAPARLLEYAAAKGIGPGGHDIIPNGEAQMKEPTLTYKNEATGKPFTREEFTAYATDDPGVNTIFWNAETPWLKQ